MAKAEKNLATVNIANVEKLPLPKGWINEVKAAVVRVVSLAQLSLTLARGKAIEDGEKAAQVAIDNDRLCQELSLTLEEVRIKDGRWGRVLPHKRPHYSAVERLAILELSAARGWSLAQTADRFFVTPATIASWCRRLEDQGVDGLLALREPVNKFPDFVRYTVQRLKVLCPSLGKVKIAEILCRAGLHLGVATVGRILKEQQQKPKPASAKKRRVVTAKYANHVWHVDLTVVPTMGGFWTPWLPFALPQCWPFCWWVAIALDHYSRRAMGVALFRRQPTSEMMRAFLGRTITAARGAPKYIICDQGTQFACKGFRKWCTRRGIKPRFGAIGQRGSIAVAERFIKTLKDEVTRKIMVPLCHRQARREISLYFDWYNNFRPHMGLEDNTPNEIYYKLAMRKRKPRIEPRPNWLRPSPCARPQVLVAGQPGARFEMEVEFLAGRKHLPNVTLRRAA